MRILALLIVLAWPVSADPVADLADKASERGAVFLGFGRGAQNGTCTTEPFALEQVGDEWHLTADRSVAIFRLRPWPEGGPLHLTHNPIVGGFSVMEPRVVNPEAVQFMPILNRPSGASAASDCAALEDRPPFLLHLLSLNAGCLDGS